MNAPYVLLVEDNPDDIFIMQRALHKAGLSISTISTRVAMDGKEALDFLREATEKQDFPLLVFLDLKLPYVSGFEVLAFIREHPALHDLCVIILTSSAEERDAKRARELGANAHLVKPPKPEVLLQYIAPLLNRTAQEASAE